MAPKTPKRPRVSDCSWNSKTDSIQESTPPKVSSAKKRRRCTMSTVASLQSVPEDVIEKIESVESVCQTVEHVPSRKLLVALCGPTLVPSQRGPFHDRAASILKRGLTEHVQLMEADVTACVGAIGAKKEECEMSLTDIKIATEAVEEFEKQLATIELEVRRLTTELQEARDAQGVVWREAMECREQKIKNGENIAYYESIREQHLLPLCSEETQEASAHVGVVLPALRRMFSDNSLLLAAEDALPKNSDERTGFDIFATKEVVHTFAERVSQAEELTAACCEREARANEALEAAEKKTAAAEEELQRAQKTAEDATLALVNARSTLFSEETLRDLRDTEHSEKLTQLKVLQVHLSRGLIAVDICEELAPPPGPKQCGA